MIHRHSGVVAISVALFALGIATIAPALTLVTYNLENYTVADRMVEGEYRKSYPKPERERAALVQVVRDLAPDFLAVQEMGGPAFLREFQEELARAGIRLPHATLLVGADPDRHVAVLSRWPLAEIHRYAAVDYAYRDGRERVKRGMLEVVLRTDRGPVSVFVLHLKSKRTERADDPESSQQRALEAEAVRDIVLRRFPDPRVAKFVICGDWNDTRGTRTVRALLRRGATELGELLPAADSRGEMWTHHYRKEDTFSRIDYILVSPALKPLVEPGSAIVGDGAGTTEASDHRPVRVVLNLHLTAK